MHVIRCGDAGRLEGIAEREPRGNGGRQRAAGAVRFDGQARMANLGHTPCVGEDIDHDVTAGDGRP